MKFPSRPRLPRLRCSAVPVQRCSSFQFAEELEIRRLLSIVPQAGVERASAQPRAGDGAAPKTHLVFSQQPRTTVAGQTIAPVEVDVVDSSGHLVTSDNSPITLSIPIGANTLGGTTIVNAINGSAIFDDLVIIGAGKYTFTASDPALPSIHSKPFNIAPDPSSSQLFIKEPPAISLIGKRLFPSILVSVNDQFGNLITTDHSVITVSVFSGPTGGALAGDTSQTANKGIATFKDIIPSAAGTYVLHANDSSLQVTTALAINATVARAVTSIPAPRVSASYFFGQTITLTDTLKSSASPSVPFAGSVSIVNSDSQTIATAPVSANGVVKFTLADLDPGTYACTLSYPGDANHTAADSSGFTFQVNPDSTKTSLRASASKLVTGQPLTLTASISAPGNSQLAGTVTFFDDGVAFGDPVSLDESGAAQIVISAPAVGAHSYTALYSGDADALASASGKAGVNVKGAVAHIALAPSISGRIAAGTPVDLMATVTRVAPAGGTPGGSVIFEDNAAPIGTVTLSNAGTAALTGVTFTAASHHRLLAIYSGDPMDNAAISPKVMLTIT